MTRRRYVFRGLAAVIVLAGLLFGGWMWVRDSALARVKVVHVTGTTTSEERRIRAALESAARDMTTLHVREDVLHDAVARYPSVAGLRVHTDFPHAMEIEVIEHRPVAALESGDTRTPVSGDGIVLSGVRADDALPAIDRDRPAGARVDDRRTREALAVAAAAPQPLLARGERLHWGPEGLTVVRRDGPPLFFGDAAGATYLDLRVTGRVAAGGLGPIPQEPAPTDPSTVG